MNGTDTIRFCETFREYIDVTRADNRRLWQNIDRLIKRFVDERAAREKADDERGALRPTA